MSRLSFWPKIALYYFMTLVATGIFFGVQVLTGIRGEYMQFPQIGPALIAVIFIVLEGRETKLLFLKGLKPAFDRYTMIVLVQSVVLMAAVCFATTKLWGIENFNTSSGGYLGFFFTLSTVIAALCEEIGWRGYLLTRLQERMTAIKASLVLGILWGFWHVPKLLMGVEYFFVWLIGIIGLTFVMTYIFNSTKGNIWSVTLVHSSVNLMTNFFLKGAATDIRVIAGLSIMFLAWAVWMSFGKSGNKSLPLQGDIGVERGEKI